MSLNIELSNRDFSIKKNAKPLKKKIQTAKIIR